MVAGISRRQALATVLGAASSAALTLSGQAQTPVKLKVGFSPINEYTGLFVAKDQGFFERRGLDVEPTLIQNNATIPPALVGNSIQLGTPSVSTILQALEGGLPLQLICGAGVFSAAKPSISLVAKVGSGFTKAEDFRGKRIGVSALNALFHIVVKEWLSKGGVDPKTVSFVETPFTQMFDMLRGGQVDALVASEPVLSRILNGGVGERVGNILTAVMDNALSGNYTTTVDFARKNRAAMVSFKAAIEEAHVFAQSNPKAVGESIARYLQLDEKIVAAMPAPILRSRIDREQVEFWIKVAKSQGLIRREVSINSLMGEV